MSCKGCNKNIKKADMLDKDYCFDCVGNGVPPVEYFNNLDK